MSHIIMLAEYHHSSKEAHTMTLEFIDIGVNLGHASFRADREQVIQRALAAGVGHMVVTGTSVKESQAAAQLARAYPQALSATVGVHPHNARHCTPQTLQALRELARQPEVVAIGECGLDYNRDFSPRPVQDRWFEAQVQLASELRLPLFLHERDAHACFVEILDAFGGALPRAVVHCFTGDGAALRAYLDMGLYIGITGWICDERRGHHLRELVRRIPLDRLMLETDAPFLTPRDMTPRPRDGRNEPAFLPHIARAVARCLGQPVEEVARATTATAQAFFRKSGTDIV
jgi:TatD DNase family protein